MLGLDHVVFDRDRGLTMGDVERMLRDAEPVARDRWAPKPEVTVYVAQIALTGGDEIDPVMIEHAREACMIDIERHIELHGLVVQEVTWYSDRLLDEPIGVNIRAAAKCVERTDGEWPAIRAALLEDEADRREADLAATYTGSRLDALRESVGIWSSSNPHAALEAPTTASSVTLTRLAADGSPLPDTLPTTVTGRVRLSFDR